VVPFGSALHVSGTDAPAIDATLSAQCGDAHGRTRIVSGLEDVFIGLMDKAKDNYS